MKGRRRHHTHVLLPSTAHCRLTRQSIPVIAFGTILGHGVCTFGAVLGGRYLSTKISVKHSECSAAVSSACPADSPVSLIGAVAFLVFGLLYAVEAWGTPWDAQAGDDFEW
jgi:putative Ca2+/H+ antiporter (TMEM165/GDT1 family)